MQILGKASHIALVECRLDLVEKAEGRGFEALDGKQKGDGRQGLLSAGELHHVLELFARGLRDHAHACLEDIHILHEFQLSASAAEQLPENGVIGLLNVRELFPELSAHGIVEFRHDLFQRSGGFGEVIHLALEEGISFHEFLIFIDGADIDISQGFDLSPEGGDLFFHRRKVCKCLIALGSRIRDGHLVFLPHIGSLLFNGLFEAFASGSQTEDFLIQAGDHFRRALAFPGSLVLLILQVIVLLPQCLQLLFLFDLDVIGIGRLLPEALDLLCLLFYLPAVIFSALEDRLQLCLQSLQFAPDPLRILLLEAQRLFRAASFQFQRGERGAVAFLVLLSFGQFLLQLCRGSSEFLFFFLTGSQILRRSRLLCGSLQCPLFEGAQFLAEGLHISRGLAELFLLLLDPYTKCVLADEGLLQSALVFIKFSAQDVTALLCILDRLFLFLHLLFEALSARGQLLDFTSSSQETAGIAVSTAADGAAGRKKLAFQCHHAHAVSIAARSSHCVVEGVHDHSPAQKRDRHIGAAGSRSHQGIGRADDTLLTEDLVSGQAPGIPDSRKRQEGCPACFFAFEDGDHAPGRVFILCDDILYTAPERNFDGCLVFFICGDQIRDGTDNAGFPGSFLHDTFYAAAEALIALRQIYDRLEFGFLLMP